MTYKFKIKVDSCNDQHCKFTVFANSNDGDTFANCGQLCMSPQEFLVFTCAINIGKDDMNRNYPHIEIQFDDEVYTKWTKQGALTQED